jgi:hypothetical protein
MGKPACWIALTSAEQKEWEDMAVAVLHSKQETEQARGHEYWADQAVKKLEGAYARLRGLHLEEMEECDKQLRLLEVTYEEACESCEEAYRWIKEKGLWNTFCTDTGTDPVKCSPQDHV